MYQGGRNANLFHPSGVPSFDGFVSAIQPGCCDGTSRAARIADVQLAIQSDFGPTPENRQLALDMLNHFVAFGNTMSRNCALGWGIYLVFDGICALILFGDYLGVGGIIVLLIAVGLLICWGVYLGRDSRSEAALRQREQAALGVPGGAALHAPLTS
jgi:hypothetical protein